MLHLFETQCIANLVSIFFWEFVHGRWNTSRSRSICATYGSVPDFYCFITAIAIAATSTASNLSHVRHTNYCGMFLHLYFHILLAIDKNLSCARQVNRCTQSLNMSARSRHSWPVARHSHTHRYRKFHLVWLSWSRLIDMVWLRQCDTSDNE